MNPSALYICQFYAVCACVCMLVCYYFIPGENKDSPQAFCQHNGPLFSLTWFSTISSSLISSLTSLSLFTPRSFLGPPPICLSPCPSHFQTTFPIVLLTRLKSLPMESLLQLVLPLVIMSHSIYVISDYALPCVAF